MNSTQLIEIVQRRHKIAGHEVTVVRVKVDQSVWPPQDDIDAKYIELIEEDTGAPVPWIIRIVDADVVRKAIADLDWAQWLDKMRDDSNGGPWGVHADEIGFYHGEPVYEGPETVQILIANEATALQFKTAFGGR